MMISSLKNLLIKEALFCVCGMKTYMLYADAMTTGLEYAAGCGNDVISLPPPLPYHPVMFSRVMMEATSTSTVHVLQSPVQRHSQLYVSHLGYGRGCGRAMGWAIGVAAVGEIWEWVWEGIWEGL